MEKTGGMPPDVAALGAALADCLVEFFKSPEYQQKMEEERQQLEAQGIKVETVSHDNRTFREVIEESFRHGWEDGGKNG